MRSAERVISALCAFDLNSVLSAQRIKLNDQESQKASMIFIDLERFAYITHALLSKDRQIQDIHLQISKIMAAFRKVLPEMLENAEDSSPENSLNLFDLDGNSPVMVAYNPTTLKRRNLTEERMFAAVRPGAG